MPGVSWTSFRPPGRKKRRRQRRVRLAGIIFVVLVIYLIYKTAAVFSTFLPGTAVDHTSKEVLFKQEAVREEASLYVELFFSVLGREIPGISSSPPGEFTVDKLSRRAVEAVCGFKWEKPASIVALEIAGMSPGEVPPGFSSGYVKEKEKEKENGDYRYEEEEEIAGDFKPEPPAANGEDEETGEEAAEIIENETETLNPGEHAAYGEMKILVYHSHITETFVPDAGEPFTENLDLTVAHLGNKLCDILEEEYDIPTIHHREVFDIPRRTAYQKARPAVESLIEENPGIVLVIDLHRDGIGREVTTAEVEGDKMGKLLFITGSNHERWSSNYATALAIERELKNYKAGLSRGVRKMPYTYNQDLHHRSVLVEMGGHENSMEEVKKTVPVLAEILARTYKQVVEEDS